MAKKIVAFGEVLWDVLPNGKVLGGTPSNLVFRCNSFGEEGFLLSRVGDDKLGIAALKKLVELGISDENVQIDSVFPTGTVNISFDEKGDPIYNVTLDVAFDHIEFSAEALKLARNADCLFFGLLPLRFGLSKNTIRELIKESPESIKFFDLKLFEHFFDKKTVEFLLQNCNIVRIKEKEVAFLTEKLELETGSLEHFGTQLSEKFKVDLILITRGQNGIFAYHKNEGAFWVPAYRLKVKDNIGSGMALAAGFLHYYLNGKSIAEALDFGNAAGALNTLKRGATTFFGKTEVLSFMKENSKRKLVP